MNKKAPTDSPADNGDLHAERTDYQQDQLTRAQMPGSPFTMFSQWMQTARDSDLIDATAMTLATTTRDGLPSARIVLLKQFSEAGFCWYTNYESRKGSELAQNPNAALLFYWRELERQIRIEGTVEKMSAEDSAAYFDSRPDGSKYSAVVSPQSQVVPNQAWLANRKKQLAQEQTPDQLERPEFWGGYQLTPHSFEFWQGRPSRSHDRFRYLLNEDDQWQLDRLAP